MKFLFYVRLHVLFIGWYMKFSFVDYCCYFVLQDRMMMLKVIARTVGLHRLILLNFYPFLQKYVQVNKDFFAYMYFNLKPYLFVFIFF